MADFSIKETQLSAPQGAGTGPVQAVQSAGSNLLQNLSTMGDIFAKGLGDQKKLDADARKQKALSTFAKEQAALSDAVDQGKSYKEISVRSRTSYSAAVASNPELADDYQKIMSGLKNHGGLGDVVSELDLVKKQRSNDLDMLAKRGIIVPEGATELEEKAYINSAKVNIRVEQQQEEFNKRQAEYRAGAKFTSEQLKEMEKENSIEVVNTIAKSTLSTFQADITSTINMVTSGRMTQQDAQAFITGKLSTIQGQVAAAARGDSSMVGVYMAPFLSMHDMGMKMADPKVGVANSKSQFDQIIQGQKLDLILNDPQLQQLVAANSLFQGNPYLGVALGKEIVKLTAQITSSNPKDKANTIPIVGNAEVEKKTYDFLKKSLEPINGNVEGKATPKAIEEVSNGINHILEEIGTSSNKKGMTPKQLVETASFLSSSQFGAFSAKTKLSPDAMSTAKHALAQVYVPTIVDTVQKRLEGNLNQTQSAYAAGNPRTQIIQTVDPVFTGTGVVFQAISRPGMDRAELSGVEATIKSLNSSQLAINQIIHMTAHLSGSTDYKKTWEENRHKWMPSVYPDPSKLKEGQIVKAPNGKSYKYIGGNFNDIDRNYVEVPSGQGK